MTKKKYETVVPVEVVRPAMTGVDLAFQTGMLFFKAWALMVLLPQVFAVHLDYWQAYAVVLLISLFTTREYQSWTRMRRQLR